jgi:hypothetical protein
LGGYAHIFDFAIQFNRFLDGIGQQIPIVRRREAAGEIRNDYAMRMIFIA